MHPIKRHPIIIGLIVLFGLSFQAESAYALYSPVISRQVSVIRQHLAGSIAQNGDGSILKTIESLKAYDKAKREAFEETGIAGEARIAQDLVFENTYDFLIRFPYDSLLMVFNFEMLSGTFISNCLRDEIWSLEVLRDVIAAEMVKAYLLRDTFHGNLLEEDYRYLITQISLLRQFGSDPRKEVTVRNAKNETRKITSHKYFFGEPIGTRVQNYYSVVGVFDSSDSTGCPDGEFEEAIEQVKNSWEVLKVLGSGGNVEWGNIWQMAGANARIRARQWIKANQISLTLGGESGARIQSLVKGGGFEKFVGDFETQAKILNNMVGPVTPFWNLIRWTGSSIAQKTGLSKECAFFNAETSTFQNCTDTQIEDYRRCEEDEKQARTDRIRCNRFVNTQEALSIVDKANKQTAKNIKNQKIKKEVETAFVYHISLDSVAEQTIYDMDGILWEMNLVIKSGYEGVDKGTGESIPTMVNEIAKLVNKQCVNKQ